MLPHPAAEPEPEDGDALPVQRPLGSRALLVLWPAFVAAGVLEMLVFAMVDPGDLHGAETLAWSRSAVYTGAFLIFWAVVSLASAVTLWLATPGPDSRSS